MLKIPPAYKNPFYVTVAMGWDTATKETDISTTTGVPVGPAESPDAPTGPGAITTPQPPPVTKPPEEEHKDYCGPDISQAMLEAINRLWDRVQDLPDSEKGVWDGVWFMNNNGDAFDAIVSPLLPEGPVPVDADPRTTWICPSGKCATLSQAFRPSTLWGYCLPQHMINEILASFVGSAVGVPLIVFVDGANFRELLNYGHLEGNAPLMAYQTGYGFQDAIEDDADGHLDQQEAKEIMDSFMQGKVLGFFRLPNRYQVVIEEYPWLLDCLPCPDATPGHFSKDFTSNEWTLKDGSKVGLQ